MLQGAAETSCEHKTDILSPLNWHSDVVSPHSGLFKYTAATDQHHHSLVMFVSIQYSLSFSSVFGLYQLLREGAFPLALVANFVCLQIVYSVCFCWVFFFYYWKQLPAASEKKSGETEPKQWRCWAEKQSNDLKASAKPCGAEGNCRAVWKKAIHSIDFSPQGTLFTNN